MHTLILGQTRTGKTTVAMDLAKAYAQARRPVVVLTVPGLNGQPKDSDRWRKTGAALVTTDKAKFLAVLRSPKTWGVMVMVDEANQTVGWHDSEMEALATDGSSNGLTCHFIAQRGATFNLTVREQCTRLLMFRQGAGDARRLFESFAHPDLLNGPQLQNGEFYRCTNEPGSCRLERLPLYFAQQKGKR
jgi:hypothetical protein